jgi:Predicted membrane protein
MVLLLPFVLANALLAALGKLGLGPTSSLLAALGIFLGSTINVPVTRIERQAPVEYLPNRLLGLHRLLSRPVQRRTYTVIAVNVGGCLVPTALAGYQAARLAVQAPSVLPAAGAALAINVALCYYVARPVQDVGITMPPLVPAGAAALCGLLFAPEWAPPIAFMAGVLGPLIGADFLHLDDIAEIGTGMASLGGAGTFDGIVLSGLVATLLVPGAL